MLSTQDRAAKYRSIEQLRNTRVANVRLLAQLHGSWAGLGKATGHSAAFWCAVAGPNPTRNIGERVARRVEQVLQLNPGWLDSAH